MHRKVLGIAAALAVLAAITAGPATAGKNPFDDVQGRKCANILPGNGLVDTTAAFPEPGTLLARLVLQRPSCTHYIYSVIVLDDPDSTTPLKVISTRGDAVSDVLLLRDSVDDPDGEVCVYLTVTSPGGRLFDRADDTSCKPLATDGSAGLPFHG